MRFIVDAQLPPALAEWLRRQGHDAKAVRDAGLRDSTDANILTYAIGTAAIVVTKDEDFVLMPTTDQSPQIVWVRTGNLVNRLLLARFEQAWPEVETHLLAGARIVELR